MTIGPSKLTVCEAVQLGTERVPEQVAAQAAEEPDTIALSAGREALTYRELDSRANRLANYLLSIGVGRGSLVGLCLPRSLDMVVGALGIWKAGGTYLPMDPAYPADRLAFMLEDAQASALITTAHLATRLSSTKRKALDIGAPQIARLPAESLLVALKLHDLAYVIYTSGSTGGPKGVEITDGGLANLVSWHRQAFSVTAADRASHVAGLGFDAAIWELWPYLAAGASIHLAD